MSTRQVELKSSSVDPQQKKETVWGILNCSLDVEDFSNILTRISKIFYEKDVNCSQSFEIKKSQQKVCIKSNTQEFDFTCPCKNKGNVNICKSEVELNFKVSLRDILKKIGVVLFYHIMFYGILHKRSK